MTTGWSVFLPCDASTRASSSSLDTRAGAPPAMRNASPWLVIRISIGSTGVVSLLPTDGRAISPGVIRGAVTMKMTSSTSITSMYGTTLIWLMAFRGRRIGVASALALQDVAELFDEGVEAGGEAIEVVRVAVISDDRRY